MEILPCRLLDHSDIVDGRDDFKERLNMYQLSGFIIVGIFGLCGIAFTLWYDHYYTPRHKKKNNPS